ncbi:acyltransferase [Noviherbaspirillum cavernae]|uniref:Acyltransferase n=1 Tax=Noviherbaspirillum cavernae TaxID=2320862 RepID=A0A418X3Z6_9BURK|nr:acyltransferase [Noviherbaspirillum cavernae]RJG07155.1 acyltransferase [Noviherbaspirillum cavernae]
MSQPARLPLVDGLKAAACLLIICHHLAFYGPMSDRAYSLAPELIDWLYHYGRMAVQVFLVVGGFLAAGALESLDAGKLARPDILLWRRYRRLAVPCMAALACAILSAMLVRPWLDHPSVPAPPELTQVLAHVFLLQDLLEVEALSAGVWYVAIDFQLYALALGLCWLSRNHAGAARPTILVLAFTMASLLFFNLDASWDATSLYFFGAYGLGMLAFRASRQRTPQWAAAGLAALGGLALLLAFRERIAVALATALLLGLAPSRGWMHRGAHVRGIAWLARRSYSVFLIHFPICLLVNSLWAQCFPEGAWINLAGMALALVASVAAGALFFRLIEEHHADFTRNRYYRRLVPAGLLLCAAISMATSQ